ncbi:MAG: ribulose-phosphate 3-epimerase [Mycoplasma sp.]|nr:ribulose-phosphate 3-epimerase [Mycoplasma sp.]
MSKNQNLEASLLAFDSKNEKHFKQQLDCIYNVGIKNIHYDVMDGKNVPNIAYGTEWLKELYLRNFNVSVHFMVNKPWRWFNQFILYPFNNLSFQVEPICKLKGIMLLKKIRRSGHKCGIAFKPYTNVLKYTSLIKKCDFVVIMGVEPGFGGQEFLKDQTLKNLKLINQIKKEKNLNLSIVLDGGVNFNVIKLTSKYVDVYVSGSFLLKQKNPKTLLDFIKNI